MTYVLTGDNAFERRRYAEEVIQKFVQEHGDLAVERFDDETVSPATITDAVQSMPFLTSAKLVIVSGLSDKGDLEQIAELSVPDTTDLLVIIPKPDKRASYYKKLSKLPGFKNFEQASPSNLPAWVATTVKQQGGVISNSDARYLVDRVGTDQLLISNEIDKLITYNPTITRQSIELLCEPLPQTSIFQLIDAAFGGDMTLAEKIYREQRAQRVEPHAILGMIAWQLHILAVVKTSSGSSVDDIARTAKLNPFVVRKSQGIAKRLSGAHIAVMVHRAQQLDTALKTAPIDADQALQNLLLQLAPQ